MSILQFKSKILQLKVGRLIGLSMPNNIIDLRDFEKPKSMDHRLMFIAGQRRLLYAFLLRVDFTLKGHAAVFGFAQGCP